MMKDEDLMAESTVTININPHGLH